MNLTPVPFFKRICGTCRSRRPTGQRRREAHTSPAPACGPRKSSCDMFRKCVPGFAVSRAGAGRRQCDLRGQRWDPQPPGVGVRGAPGGGPAMCYPLGVGAAGYTAASLTSHHPGWSLGSTVCRAERLGGPLPPLQRHRPCWEVSVFISSTSCRLPANTIHAPDRQPRWDLGNQTFPSKIKSALKK